MKELGFVFMYLIKNNMEENLNFFLFKRRLFPDDKSYTCMLQKIWKRIKKKRILEEEYPEILCSCKHPIISLNVIFFRLNIRLIGSIIIWFNYF